MRTFGTRPYPGLTSLQSGGHKNRFLLDYGKKRKKSSLKRREEISRRGRKGLHYVEKIIYENHEGVRVYTHSTHVCIYKTSSNAIQYNNLSY